MGGIIGKIFGSDDVIKAARDTGDKLFHTAEEKADHYLNVMKMYEAFKLAQRLIAMTVLPPYVLAWFVTFLVSFSSVKIEAQQAMLEGRMGDLVLAIVGFYFLGGAAEGSMRAINWFKAKKD
jgi:hypothetical protein